MDGAGTRSAELGACFAEVDAQRCGEFTSPHRTRACPSSALRDGGSRIYPTSAGERSPARERGRVRGFRPIDRLSNGHWRIFRARRPHRAAALHAAGHTDPDRFAPEAVKARDRYVYLPFGAGPRICIGMSFAQMEATAVLAVLLFRCASACAPATSRNQSCGSRFGRRAACRCGSCRKLACYLTFGKAKRPTTITRPRPTCSVSPTG